MTNLLQVIIAKKIKIIFYDCFIGKTSLSPANAWVKANEMSVVAIFPRSAVTEAQDVFPDVTLEQ